VNVLLLGGGGREHALAWGLAKSGGLRRLVVAPGNAGTGRLAENVALDPTNASDVAAFCRQESIDLVVIGPEAPLVAGVADRLRAEGVLVFGPSAEGARLESSKAHAKELMRVAGVPTAKFATVRSVAEAAKALDWVGARVAVKADGLAAGKGVVMASTRDEALAAVRAAVEERVFGNAGSVVVLEEWLDGEELSMLALVDGEEVRALPPSQDHKRAFDGDTGPNTGGMGAYAPVPWLGRTEADAIVERCLVPVARELVRRGVVFRGVLYAGVMRTKDGPRVLEYNVRFGDPETQVLIPLVDGDLLEVLHACAAGTLATLPALRAKTGAALTIVAASQGYPGAVKTGVPIEGLEADDDRGGAIVFHAGTARAPDGRIATAGGRVLAVTGLGTDLATARRAAYDALESIRFPGMFHRTDIGARGIAKASDASIAAQGRSSG
jgi:phosphoribosylamine--glycine ligase